MFSHARHACEARIKNPFEAGTRRLDLQWGRDDVAGVCVMSVPFALSFPAADGYVLHGHVWANRPAVRQPAGGGRQSLATAVLSRYYARFAAYLHAAGCEVLTWRLSRHWRFAPSPGLRGFRAGWIEWAAWILKAPCVAQRRFAGQLILVAAHSAGGLAWGWRCPTIW